jgi:hypothetical protein
MPGFLAWTAGRAPATAIRNATPTFIAQAREHPPNVTPVEREERIRVVRIRVLAVDPPVAVVDLTPAGGVPFELAFYLLHTRRGWLVDQLANTG